MKQDPIIAEIHKFRAAFAKKHGYDLGRMVAALQESEMKRKEALKAKKSKTSRRKAA